MHAADMTTPIYLDYNATTPLAPEVVEAMRPVLEGRGFGNPSSSHAAGVEARRLVEDARRRVADLLCCAEEDEVIFTSGGTEANNLAILGAARANQKRGRHIITSTIEHPAVTQVCRALEREGFRVTSVPVDDTGRVDPAAIERAMTDETILVTVMHANNEVGTIQPITEIARIAHAGGALVHTDAAQSVGKIPTRVDELGVDLLSVAGHKLYGPKGVGALFLRSGTPLDKILHGADHESNRRPGTENVLEIVGLGAAATLATEHLVHLVHLAHLAHLVDGATQQKEMRDRLHRAIADALPDVHLNGHTDERLPNTLSLAFPGLEAGDILEALPDICASAGAACHSDGVNISQVLLAMAVPERLARGTLRLSTGRPTTAAEIDRAAALIIDAVKFLRR